MAKTITWIDAAVQAKLNNGEGLESVFVDGDVQFQAANDDVLATVDLHVTDPFSITGRVANVQRAGGGGFSGTTVTPSADGTVSKGRIRNSAGVVQGTFLVALTGGAGADDAVFTFNNLAWNTGTDVSFTADFTLTHPA